MCPACGNSTLRGFEIAISRPAAVSSARSDGLRHAPLVYRRYGDTEIPRVQSKNPLAASVMLTVTAVTLDTVLVASEN